MDTSLRTFLEKYPNYILTRSLDELRLAEYDRLDAQDMVYVDYTGGGLYADSQIRDHMDMLRNGVFGNPHSVNPSSIATTRLVEHAREYVLKYFNAPADEYVAIFTPNATGALKLVGEAYPFESGGRYLLTFDNHNSVNGIREFARAKGSEVTYIPVVPPDLRVDEDSLDEFLAVPASGPKLFAYPAQSNFSGVKHPLDWVDKAHAKGWDVLVDCAAFVPTNRLDLTEVKPDFVPLSFYKMFGYPTGVGCLIARKEALEKLHRPWFAGGTITIASVQADSHYLAEGVEAFEDGTINYLNLPAVEIGLKHLENVGIGAISDRVTALTGWLLDQLLALRHSNGLSLVRVYGPTDIHMRGGTITANFYDPDERMIDHRRIEELASDVRICLRAGCFCNPGAGEIAHGLTKEEMEEGFSNKERMTFEQFLTVLERIGGKSAGAVRISLGLASNFDDVYRVVEFARGLLDCKASQV
ncbi:MAG: aminotransferase class V-fold PLP-dependent enzyme [Chloroflexi bacterium]|nr:aminotransferase class V-fold PLP-dependent enzyme [Chloroflexota bacterium]